MNVINSAGADVPAYATLAEAINWEILEPISAGLDGDPRDPEKVYDIVAIAEAVIEYHTEKDGDAVRLDRSGFCLSLAGDDELERAERFWEIVEQHARSLT